MESRPDVPDRKLLARLVLIREEARNMMGGGILDERNDRGLNTLPESEVCQLLNTLYPNYGHGSCRQNLTEEEHELALLKFVMYA